MAATGNFSDRLHRLWDGFILDWVTETGDRHPEIAWQRDVNQLAEKAGQARIRLVGLATRCEILFERLGQSLSELKRVAEALDGLDNSGQQALNLVLKHRQHSLVRDLEELHQHRHAAVAELSDCARQLAEIETERRRLNHGRDRMLARMPEAAAILAQRLGGVSVKVEMRLLARISRLNTQETQAQPGMGEYAAANDTRTPAQPPALAGSRPLSLQA